VEQPERFAGLDLSFRFAGLRERPFRVERNNRVDMRIERLELIDRFLHELNGRDLSAPDLPPQLDRGEAKEA
jgi:hypothetical protein